VGEIPLCSSGGACAVGPAVTNLYRGTSLIRICPPIGPYRGASLIRNGSDKKQALLERKKSES